MPCDSITTQSVALTKAMPDLVAEAMKALGWRINVQSKTQIEAYTSSSYVTWRPGQGIIVRGYNQADQQSQITALTKAYSVKAATWAAQRAGWEVKQTAPDKLTVTRR